MQKGSLVTLKNSPFVLTKAVIYTVEGRPFPFKGGVYTLASDIEEQMCDSCGRSHKIVFLEEIPNEAYPYDIFVEVQAPNVVQVTELFDSSEQ